MMYSPFRHISSVFSKKHPIHLTFFVTRRCNARCPFCFYLKAEDDQAETEKELSLGEIMKVSLSLAICSGLPSRAVRSFSGKTFPR